jgi:hypothetical protein
VSPLKSQRERGKYEKGGERRERERERSGKVE